VISSHRLHKKGLCTQALAHKLGLHGLTLELCSLEYWLMEYLSELHSLPLEHRQKGCSLISECRTVGCKLELHSLTLEYRLMGCKLEPCNSTLECMLMGCMLEACKVTLACRLGLCRLVLECRLVSSMLECKREPHNSIQECKRVLYSKWAFHTLWLTCKQKLGQSRAPSYMLPGSLRFWLNKSKELQKFLG